MKKGTKKLLALILSVIMIFSALPMTNVFASNINDTGACGDMLTWSIDNDGKLTIAGKGDMWDYYYQYSNNLYSPWRDNQSIKTVVIENGVTRIGDGAFSGCSSLTSVTIPDSVTRIGNGAFDNCTSLTSVMIPDSVTRIGNGAFRDCSSLTSVTIPDSVTGIVDDAFYCCSSLTSVTIPDSVTSIGNWAFYSCDSLTDVYYSSSEEDWKNIDIYSGNDNLINANIHFNSSASDQNIYNLGEETYSFRNYSDSDSRGGHCFGMSATSSAYYLGLIDYPSTTENTYSLPDNLTTKNPICYYQDIQGRYRDKSMVAGGYNYKFHIFKQYDIKSDWNNVVNYVKDHSHDEKGDLQIGFRKAYEGGHAINFLRYENVDGQDRIYAYDNNFPTEETYFYKGTDGKVYQAVRSTFSGSIDCIALRDMNKYFNEAKKYKAKKNIYASSDSIAIENAEYVSPMDLGDIDIEYYMFELPDEATEIEIKPLKDNAEFTYMNETYTFNDVDENTVGILKLAETDDDTAEVKFKITEKEDEKPTDPTPPPAEPTKPCTCKCHSSGFSLFIWKIGNFFHKIFRMDKYYECACGDKHW